MGEGRSPAFYWLAAFFAAFVLFLYGPMIVIFILSFQGPGGGLTFPMMGTSLRWFAALFEHQMVGDFQMTFVRSFALGLIVMVITVTVSLSAGLAFRRRFRGRYNILMLVARVEEKPVGFFIGFELKPTVFFWLASIAFLGSAWIGRETLTQRFLGAAFGERLKLTAPLWRQLNLWWTAFYALLGALNLSRAVSDPNLSREILHDVREELIGLVKPESHTG